MESLRTISLSVKKKHVFNEYLNFSNEPMKLIITIASIFFWTLQACNSPNRNKETNSKDIDNRDIPMDNGVDTTGNGNDTLGKGDEQGPDYF